MYVDRKVSREEINELVNKEETHFYDHKSIEVSGEKIQKIAVAFANADGGEFIIGIKDSKESFATKDRWEGVDDKEKFNFVFQNLNELSPTIPHEWEFLKDSDGGFALRVIIEKSTSVHKTAKNLVYIRRSAQSLQLKDIEKIKGLSYAKGETSYEDSIIKDAYEEDIFNSDEIQRFLKEIELPTTPKDFAVKQNLIDRKTYEPKAAGILLFCDNPVPLMPNRCGIKITRYETSEIEPSREHLKEQMTIEGCLNEQIVACSKAISEIMDSVKIMGTTGLENVRYPNETIWEILVNAVIHRDYAISDDIHILIFNNRIEIKSPGKLPGYVTVENILGARFSRNSKIVRTLNKYKNPVNKDMGEGLNTAFQKMQEFRLKPPIISESGNYIKVVIAHTPLASPEESVMQYLEINLTIKNRQARQITGISSENKMKGIFYKLRDKGLIEPVKSKTGDRVVAWKKSVKLVSTD